MKAVVLHELGGPDKLCVEDVVDPYPAAGEVRVALKASALNRRDYWITVGAYPRIRAAIHRAAEALPTRQQRST